MNIDINQVIRKLENKAKNIYVDKDKLKDLLNSAVRMIEENQQLKAAVQDITIMIQLIKDWIKGDYKNLSKTNIILIITALLYLVIPLDLIPDFLPMGFIDDIIVISFIVKKISNEINEYKIWKGISNEDYLENLLGINSIHMTKEIKDSKDDDYYEL